jgi:hypothetical protein
MLQVISGCAVVVKDLGWRSAHNKCEYKVEMCHCFKMSDYQRDPRRRLSGD